MPKTLIIAEKTSVATDLARVLGKIPELGKFQKKKDFFENEHAYISSAVGHLVELKMPEGPNGKKLPWGMKHLPIIPPKFELQPIERSLARYKVLLRLLKKKDIDTVVNACDAEGAPDHGMCERRKGRSKVEEQDCSRLLREGR